MTVLTTAWSQGRASKTRSNREPVLVKLARLAGAKLPRWKKVRTSVMQTSAFVFIDWALFEWTLIAGLVGVGLSLLVLEFLTADTSGRG